MIAFILKFPQYKEWNNALYCVIKSERNYSNKQLTSMIGTHTYWNGNQVEISVQRIGPQLAGRMKKKSRGFCGYEWMIQSIERNYTIKTRRELKWQR